MLWQNLISTLTCREKNKGQDPRFEHKDTSFVWL